MPRSRKWLITINNPIEHDFDHARIKAAVLDLPSVVYWCMCNEQGDECETLHTHVYVVTREATSHTQIDARFPSFHRDIARGKSSENRAYVLKDGSKFNKQPDGSYSYKDTGGHLHEGINFSDTFEEGGEMPVEQQGKSRDADKIVELIKSGPYVRLSPFGAWYVLPGEPLFGRRLSSCEDEAAAVVGFMKLIIFFTTFSILVLIRLYAFFIH